VGARAREYRLEHREREKGVIKVKFVWIFVDGGVVYLWQVRPILFFDKFLQIEALLEPFFLDCALYFNM
jgi:hypothetical protein